MATPVQVQPQQPVAPVVPTYGANTGATPVVSGSGTGLTSAQPAFSSGKPKRNKKKLLLLIGLPLLVVLLISGVVFGLYLPNTPNGVWSRGLNRTGTAVEKLSTQAVDQEQLDKLTASELAGTVDAKWGEGSFSGEFTAAFDKSDVDSGLKMKMTNSDGAKQELAAKVLSQIKKDSTYPDIFFQLSGYSSLGLDAMAPGINAYDGKWIVVDADYIESAVSSVGVDADADKSEDVTSADIKELTQTFTDVSNEYVFTASEDKAVLTQKSFVGKEEVDGVKTHHYKANINNDHAKDYCKALTNALFESKAIKKLNGDDKEKLADSKKNVMKGCDSDFTLDKDMDVWIGGKHGLVKKIRIHEPDGKDYVDIGQDYDGNDEIEMYANFVGEDKPNNIKLSITTNAKTYDMSFKMDAKSKDVDIKVTLTSKASDKDIKVTPPKDAVDIQTVMNALSGQSSFGAPSAVRNDAQYEASMQEYRANNRGSVEGFNFN